MSRTNGSKRAALQKNAQQLSLSAHRRLLHEAAKVRSGASVPSFKVSEGDSDTSDSSSASHRGKGLMS